MQKKVLLLLSGGKDSRLAISLLQAEGFEVHGLCIDGIQGKEKDGAAKAAREFKIPLQVLHISFFDEETWNPFKLLLRDVAMGFVALREARRLKAPYLATGVKKSDLENPKLGWLKYFLKLCQLVAGAFGVAILFPVFEERSIAPVQKVGA